MSSCYLVSSAEGPVQVLTWFWLFLLMIYGFLFNDLLRMSKFLLFDLGFSPDCNVILRRNPLSLSQESANVPLIFFKGKAPQADEGLLPLLVE